MSPQVRFLLLLMLATAALWASGSPSLLWRELGSPLFTDGFLEPAEAWHYSSQLHPAARSVDQVPVQVTTGGIVIEPGAEQTFRLGRSVEWSADAPFIRLQARIRTLVEPTTRQRLDRSDPSTRRSVVLLRFLDASGERLRNRSVIQLDGREPVVSGDFVFPVPAGTHQVYLETFGRGYGGRFLLEHAGLQAIKPNEWRVPTTLSVALAWAFLVLVGSRWVLKSVGLTSTLALASAIAVIAWGVALNERLDANTLNALMNNRVWDSLGRPDLRGPLLFKLGHATAFALVTFIALACLGNKRTGLGVALTMAYIGVLAMASESLQRHLLERSAELTDVIIDITGSLVGLLLWLVLVRLPSSYRRRCEVTHTQ